MTSDAGQFPILESVRSPADLRRLAPQSLGPLATELRRFMIESISATGGHFAAGLGTVELTIALHYAFDTPQDTLVWDVGHQCYPHKILTGRRNRMFSVRRSGGLSGFLRRDESRYDAFGAGHSSTSISSALGMAVAASRLGRGQKTVAVIGDGAMTAGLAYEALDHAGALGADLLVIVNDNEMSISPNVGALSTSLAVAAGRASASGSSVSHVSGLFESLGFSYAGPCDGHDLPALLAALAEQRERTGPRVLHVVTRKGKGYAPAEADPVRYHGVSAFDPHVGLKSSGTCTAPAYTQVFGDWLCDMAELDPRLVAVTPAMREGSGLTRFAKRFPDRYFDVGIAEQHSVTFAAGLACQGLRPVVAIYSTFLQRAYDQLIHDVALQNLPVLFAIDRAGLVGPDGATHNGSLDLAYLRCVPGMVVMTPSDGGELRDMLYTGLRIDGPVAIRYPREPAVSPPTTQAMKSLPIGTAEIRRAGRNVAFLCFGTLLGSALEAAEELDATVVNMRFVKPLDARVVADVARRHSLVVTVEENTVAAGAGSAVNECIAAVGLATPVVNLGIPDRFVEHGSRTEVLRDAGLDRDALVAAVLARQLVSTPTPACGRRLRLRRPAATTV